MIERIYTFPIIPLDYPDVEEIRALEKYGILNLILLFDDGLEIELDPGILEKKIMEGDIILYDVSQGIPKYVIKLCSEDGEEKKDLRIYEYYNPQKILISIPLIPELNDYILTLNGIL